MKLASICLPALLMLSGCSTMEALVDVPSNRSSASIDPYDLNTHQRSVHIFDPVDLAVKVSEQQLSPRVDKLIVLLDQSETMADTFRGVDLKIFAQEMTRRFLSTLPPESVDGVVVVYDGSTNQTPNRPQDELDLSAALGLLDSPSTLPRIPAPSLPAAIDKLSEMLAPSGHVPAVVLVTKWSQLSTAANESVMRLRQQQRYGAGLRVSNTATPWSAQGEEGVCVYALGVGNRMSRSTLDTPDTCGFSVAADKVAQPRDMAHFVERVVFAGPKDSDNDGIFDYKDSCADTKIGQLVDFAGCPVFGASQGAGESL